MRFVLTAAAMAIPLAAGAAEPSAQSSPSPASGVVPNYRNFQDETVAPWREVNDNVGRIGGWKVYAKERATPATPSPAAQSAPAADAKPAPGPKGAVK